MPNERLPAPPPPQRKQQQQEQQQQQRSVFALFLLPRLCPLPFFLAAAADLPPPIVIFPTQLKVTHDDGDFRATDDQNDQHHQQKPKDVVNGVHPQRRHDEKHFNEDGPERQQASDHHGNDGVHEPDLFRDLTGDLMGLARQFVRGFGKTKVGTCTGGGGGGWVGGGNEKKKET